MMNKEQLSNVELFSSEVAASIKIWSEIAHKCDTPIYVKGGAMRDSLVNLTYGTSLKVKDLDLVVPSGFFRVVLAAQRKGFVIEERRKRKKLPMYQMSRDASLGVDLSHLLASPNNKDASESELLKQDALFSDLDVNTISYNLSTKEIHDPLDATNSINSRQINLVSERSLFLDPATIFRCLKIAAKTGFDVSPKSLEIIRKNARIVMRLESWFLKRKIDEVLEFATTDELMVMLDRLGLLEVRPEIFDYLMI